MAACSRGAGKSWLDRIETGVLTAGLVSSTFVRMGSSSGAVIRALQRFRIAAPSPSGRPAARPEGKTELLAIIAIMSVRSPKTLNTVRLCPSIIGAAFVRRILPARGNRVAAGLLRVAQEARETDPWTSS